MKQLLFVVLALFALPCPAEHQYEIYYQSETEETIQLTVKVYGVKEKQADYYACLDVVQALIFEGIQGSKRRYLPYVHDQQDSYHDHEAYYRNLFDKGGFLSFVVASSVKEKGKSNKKKYYLVNVNINFKALKESLTRHNVMRRFGV